MTVEEWLSYAARYYQAHRKHQRAGQAYMNALGEQNEQLYLDITELGPNFDPFHNDEALPQFFKIVLEKWDDA